MVLSRHGFLQKLSELLEPFQRVAREAGDRTEFGEDDGAPGTKKENQGHGTMKLEASLREVLEQKNLVLEKFYDRFLSEYPEAQLLFDGMDMKKQSLMLSAALIVSEAHSREDLPAVQHYLQVLGHQHREAGVPKEMFPAFRDCLIETISSCIIGWNDELAEAWRDAIDKATGTMFEGYDDSDFPF